MEQLIQQIDDNISFISSTYHQVPRIFTSLSSLLPALVIVNLTATILAILLTYISLHSSSQTKDSHREFLNIPTTVIMHLFSTLSSFATCLGITQTSLSTPSTKSEEKVAKKSLEKSLVQLETALKSKQLRIIFKKRI